MQQDKSEIFYSNSFMSGLDQSAYIEITIARFMLNQIKLHLRFIMLKQKNETIHLIFGFINHLKLLSDSCDFRDGYLPRA